ncbi:hypothetical protein J2Z84_004365 [Agrobacterium rubi]|nr:hypothetical protein [Agrobacterium rubi]
MRNIISVIPKEKPSAGVFNSIGAKRTRCRRNPKFRKNALNWFFQPIRFEGPRTGSTAMQTSWLLYVQS